MENLDWTSKVPVIRADQGTKRRDKQYRWVKLKGWEVVIPALVQFVGGEVSILSTLEGFTIPTDPKYVEEWGPRFTYEDYAEGMSLAAARDLVLQKREKGIDCPCCGLYVKLYKRKLNANMAMFLASLVRLHEQTHDWVSYRDCRFRGRDYNYITCWELATTGKDATGKSRTTGLWKPTTKGIDFVHGTISVPTHVFLLDNEVQGFSSSTTFIQDVDGFNYQELMRS